jgi:hypothetical protein
VGGSGNHPDDVEAQRIAEKKIVRAAIEVSML